MNSNLEQFVKEAQNTQDILNTLIEQTEIKHSEGLSGNIFFIKKIMKEFIAFYKEKTKKDLDETYLSNFVYSSEDISLTIAFFKRNFEVLDFIIKEFNKK